MFSIEITTNNGYRCSCCRNITEHTEYCDTWDDVFAQIPKTYADASQEWGDIIKYVVRDESTDEIVVDLNMRFLSGVGKYSVYKAAVWFGHIRNENVESVSSNVPDGMTFDQYENKLQIEYKLKELEKAKLAYEKALNELK
jgi:hypothetical protein